MLGLTGFVLSLQPAFAQERYTLEALLEIGREGNPTVLALRAAHRAVEDRRRASGRWENPELEYEWGSGDPRDGGPSRTVSGWSGRQALENPLTRHYRLGAVDAEVDAAGEAVRSGVLDVELEIRLHFYRILYLREMSRLARMNEEALSEIRTLIEARAQIGEVRELEAIRLRVEHMRAQNELEAAGMELDQYRRHLNTFLGNVLPEDFQLEGALEPPTGEPDLADLTRELLPGHPALTTAARERESVEMRLQESRFGWVPDPVLFGASRVELDGKVQTLGVGLRIPLWNQSRAEADEGRSRVRALAHREEALRLELEANLLIHHNHLRLYRQALRLFEEGLLGEAEASMEIAEASYRQGEISFMDYLDARRTYQSIQIEHQQALYDWHLERATLDWAAGGGTL
jgi:cobalt-zinc-cadmium efflux system outer membrane protein